MTFWLATTRVRLDLGGPGRRPAARLARAPLLQLPEDPGLRRGDPAALAICRSAGLAPRASGSPSTTVIAFLFRHDHGAFVGLATAVAACCH